MKLRAARVVVFVGFFEQLADEFGLFDALVLRRALSAQYPWMPSAERQLDLSLKPTLSFALSVIIQSCERYTKGT